MNNVKPGWQTTEFWATAAVVIGSILLAVLSPDHAETVGGYAEKAGGWLGTASLIAGGLATVAYTISRTLLKRNNGGGTQ